jgi:hypothetical protein
MNECDFCSTMTGVTCSRCGTAVCVDHLKAHDAWHVRNPSPITYGEIAKITAESRKAVSSALREREKFRRRT